MAKQEIERRFLVKKINLPLLCSCENNIIHIKQGYFELTNPATSFRVRLAHDGISVTATATIKTGSGLVRREIEFPIDRLFAKHLLSICSHFLEKNRHKVNGWEVDFYDQPLLGIIIAEKELASPDEKTGLPPWIIDAVEVTDGLSNLHLARLASELRGTGAPMNLNYLEIPGGRILKIALTGPPGSGKDGTIELLRKEFPNVSFVPEAASIVMSELGIRPSKNRVINRRFQQAVCGVQKIFETTSAQFARSENKTAIVINRATLDNALYLEGGLEEFASFFKTTLENEYSKYNAVIYLDKPPKLVFEQKRLNNPMRYEKSYEEICDRHEKLLALWKRHPNFYFINSHEDWNQKIKEVRLALIKILNGTRGE